ncbi:hypothetical protein RD792_004642 [Penstemon davidsonii]|uniref:Bet v I/Major latex protein domain-containing protein n=1 Tax=Penstemon davidsonii TaxID=160366 RepID=A0ABR0DI27_9LAMI|nr:hypothetical protein RD792_004642 [Penstemon davidsonii]
MLFPVALPDMYQSIQVLKGDGKTAGTITFVTIGDSTIKENINVMDDESKTVNYNIIEGDLLNYYNNFNVNICGVPKGNNGSLVKWSCKFDKVNQQIPNPDLVKDSAIKGFQDLDAYLLNA